MNFVLFMTPAFLASTFEIAPTWLSLATEGNYLGGALNLALWLTPFLITLIGLHFMLIKPMMNYLDQLDHETVGARKEAQTLNDQVEERLETLNERLSTAVLKRSLSVSSRSSTWSFRVWASFRAPTVS